MAEAEHQLNSNSSEMTEKLNNFLFLSCSYLNRDHSNAPLPVYLTKRLWIDIRLQEKLYPELYYMCDLRKDSAATLLVDTFFSSFLLAVLRRIDVIGGTLLLLAQLLCGLIGEKKCETHANIAFARNA